MTALTNASVIQLTSGGWIPSRHISCDQFADGMVAKGYCVFSIAKEFVSRFGGITISVENLVSASFEYAEKTVFWLDVSNVGDRTWIRPFERSLGRSLTPVGVTSNGDLILLVDENGTVYGGGDGVIVRIGSDPNDAVNAICEGREFESLPFVYEERQLRCDSEEIEFDPRTLECLTQGGWVSLRHCDTAEDVLMLECNEYVVSHAAKAFLAEFGFLKIRKYEIWQTGSLEFFPRKALVRLNTERICRWMAFANEVSLTPIGVGANGAFVVLCGSQGALYGGLPEIDDWLVRFGRNPVESLNCFCTGRDAETIR